MFQKGSRNASGDLAFEDAKAFWFNGLKRNQKPKICNALPPPLHGLLLYHVVLDPSLQ